MLQRPILYLITSGETTDRTTPSSEAYRNTLQLIQAAVTARIDLVQIREKDLSASVLYDLSTSAAAITRGSATRLLINDRADIAVAAGADGVHLTTRSLVASIVRQTFGDDLLIGVSTHSLEEARTAHEGGADFVVFGPVFATTSKGKHGEPTGLDVLKRICSELSPFPVMALGGLRSDRVTSCIQAGAAGVAGISMFNDPDRLGELARGVRQSMSEPPA
jgi:thiamine-phosphate pyrophosphorylase